MHPILYKTQRKSNVHKTCLLKGEFFRLQKNLVTGIISPELVLFCQLGRPKVGLYDTCVLSIRSGRVDRKAHPHVSL